MNRRRSLDDLPELSLTTRILASILGWLLILIGVAGLVLPGIQGILTLLLGAALLSLVSQTALRALRWTLRPWPKAWRRVLKLRRKLIERLGSRGKEAQAGEPPREGSPVEKAD